MRINNIVPIGRYELVHIPQEPMVFYPGSIYTKIPPLSNDIFEKQEEKDNDKGYIQPRESRESGANS